MAPSTLPPGPRLGTVLRSPLTTLGLGSWLLRQRLRGRHLGHHDHLDHRWPRRSYILVQRGELPAPASRLIVADIAAAPADESVALHRSTTCAPWNYLRIQRPVLAFEVPTRYASFFEAYSRYQPLG